MIADQLTQLKSYSAEAENLNVDFAVQHIIDTYPQFGVKRECLSVLIRDMVTQVVRGTV